MLYCSWDMVCDGCNCYFSFWVIFSPFTPPPPALIAQTMKLSQKWKTPGGIITSHKCTKNHDHMLYCSWDMVCDGCHCYFSFCPIFCIFILLPLNAWKMKISKQWKKRLEISSSYTTEPKSMIICYTVPEILCVSDVIVIFHFMLFFAFLSL